jgi:hypothetical protein
MLIKKDSIDDKNMSDEEKKMFHCFEKVYETVNDYESFTIVTALSGILGQLAAQSTDPKVAMSFIFGSITANAKNYLEEKDDN